MEAGILKSESVLAGLIWGSPKLIQVAGKIQLLGRGLKSPVSTLAVSWAMLSSCGYSWSSACGPCITALAAAVKPFSCQDSWTSLLWSAEENSDFKGPVHQVRNPGTTEN